MEYNGYYMLLYAIIEQAINDFLAVNNEAKWKRIAEDDKLDEDGLRRFLNRMFSDSTLVDRYMRRVIYLRDKGYDNITIFKEANDGEE